MYSQIGLFMLTIKLIIDSQLDHVPLVGLAARGICSTFSNDELLLYQLELCVVESVNNVIIHAYNRESGHEVEVNITLNHDHIEFQIIDSGKFNAKIDSLYKKKYALKDAKFLPESGAGLFIIYNFMDTVSYSRELGKNILKMQKKSI